DPETGVILRTIESNRVVTGVTWIDGELWHGTWEGNESDVRRVDPRTGQVLERVEMPPGVGVSGLEADGGGRVFCGGGSRKGESHPATQARLRGRAEEVRTSVPEGANKSAHEIVGSLVRRIYVANMLPRAAGAARLRRLGDGSKKSDWCPWPD